MEVRHSLNHRISLETFKLLNSWFCMLFYLFKIVSGNTTIVFTSDNEKLAYIPENQFSITPKESTNGSIPLTGRFLGMCKVKFVTFCAINGFIKMEYFWDDLMLKSIVQTLKNSSKFESYVVCIHHNAIWWTTVVWCFAKTSLARTITLMNTFGVYYSIISWYFSKKHIRLLRMSSATLAKRQMSKNGP